MLVHSYYLMDPRVRRQAECLAEIGYEVHVISCRLSFLKHSGIPSYQVVKNVHIHLLPLYKKRGGTLRYLFEYASMTILGMLKILLLNAKNKIDIIHIHNMPDILVLAGLPFKWNGTTLILDIHDPMSELYQQTYKLDTSHPVIRAIAIQERFSYRLATQLVTVSYPMASNVAEKTGCPEKDVMVTHNFPDLNMFPIITEKRKWPYSKDDFIFLYSGTITDHYRLDIAVRALAIAARSVPGIRLYLLGMGTSLQKILSLARALSITDRVKHIKPIELKKVKEIMANVDAGISTHEAGVFGDLYFSTKIIEFMTQGLPVLSSRTYTIHEYVPEDAIFYFEPENIENLAEQMIYMYKNPDVVMKRIDNSKKILSKYNWQAEKARYQTFYKGLTDNPINRHRASM